MFRVPMTMTRGLAETGEARKGVRLAPGGMDNPEQLHAR